MRDSNHLLHLDRSPMGFCAWRGDIGDMAHAHHHPDIELNVVTKGQIEYFLAGERVAIRAGEVGIFWAAMPHQTIRTASPTDEPAHVGGFLMPAPWVLNVTSEPRYSSELLAGAMLIGHDHSVELINAVTRWHDYLEKHDRKWEHIVALEAESTLRTLELTGFEIRGGTLCKVGREAHWRTQRTPESGGVKGSRMRGVELVQAMAAFLSTRFREPISTVDVAEHVGVHPNSAARVFKRHMGVTTIQYLTRQRVAEAQRLLLTTSQPITSICYSCGFGSASRFHEAFRSILNTTPARYRDLRDDAD